MRGSAGSEEAVVVQDMDEEDVGPDYGAVPVGLESVRRGPAENPFVLLYRVHSQSERNAMRLRF